MMKVEQLQREIEALPDTEFSRLRRWFAEKDWERWDQQLESDATAGKLDFLVTEAAAAMSGVSMVVTDTPRILSVRVTEDSIVAGLTDGRTISVPLAWSWQLSEVTPEQRNNWRLIGRGEGVHWPDVDEDISASGMLYGRPARPRKAVVAVT